MIYMFPHVGDFSVSKVFYNFEDLGPTREGTFICPFVLIHGHDELELLGIQLALFSVASRIGAPPTGPASPIEPAATIHHVFSAAFGTVPPFLIRQRLNAGIF